MATCSSADSVLEAAALIKSNGTKLDTFVNGTSTQTVQLGTGAPTPTLRKFIAEAQNIVNLAANDAAQTVVDEVAELKPYVDAQSYGEASRSFLEQPWMQLFLSSARPELREAVLTGDDFIVAEILEDGRDVFYNKNSEFSLFLQPEHLGSASIFIDEHCNEIPVQEICGRGDVIGFLQPDTPAAVWGDANGSPIAILEKEGDVYFPAASSWPVPWVEDGKVFAAFKNGGSRVVGRLAAGIAVKAAFPFNARSFRIATQNAAGSLVDDGMFLPCIDSRTLHCFLIIGQSLSVGSQGFPLVTTTPPVDGMCLMLSGDGISDIRMGLNTQALSTITVLDASKITGFQNVFSAQYTTRGQTLAESLAYAVAKAEIAAGLGWKTLWICAGVGGTGYSGLKKGTTAYSNALAAITKAKSIAYGQGFSLVVDAMILKHGEADAANVHYYECLVEWQSDFETDIKAITGQSKDIPMIIPMMSFMSIYQDSYKSSEGMLRAHVESSKHWVTGVDYPFPYCVDDYTHLIGPGYHMLGESIANEVMEATYFGGCEIVRMVDATRNGTVVTATFKVPHPPLAIDTVQITEREGTCKGFTYSSNGGEVNIAAAEVVDNGMSGLGVIRLTLGAEPTGGGEVLRIARLGHDRTKAEATIARSNVRDSAGDRRKSTYDGRRLDNWAVHQEISVTVE